uniref:RRM domain-containing protein n=1 Tax=Ditylum brightwellii TaxID=49249 RepID=A0A7S4RDP7_9STRA
MSRRERHRDDDDRRDRRRSRSRSRSRDREEPPPPSSAAPAGLPVGMGSTITPPTAAAYGGMMMPGAQAGAMPGMVPVMMMPNPLMVATAAQDKVNRELFVGNTPPGTSEALLTQFLNGAMRRTKLCAADAMPIIQCRTNQKFAFVECASIADANLALNLNGIPFMGSSLRVSRPSKYAGPHVPSKTWQELTGQTLPVGLTPVPENTSPAEDKVNRELFIGNTTPEMTESMLTDFLGKAMEQVGLATHPGNPITACRVSGKFAFIELRSKEETANALNLNNIPYLGAQLRVGRPSKYVGAQTPHGNWEDILAKYMSGELKLPSQGGAPAAAPAPAANTGVPTRVVELKNMLTMDELTSDQDYEEIMEDTKEECSQFGSLKNLVIPRDGPGATKIFLEYMSTDDAAAAIKGLAGRTFDGRKVEAIFYDETKFANKEY